jgi:trk system potassium uptake protein
MSMRVMVIGGGRVGGALVEILTDAGHDVTLVEKNAERAARIATGTPAVRVMAGDGADPAVLESAGIRRVDVLATVTGDDACNLVVTSLARLEFEVPRAIARIVDPVRAWLYDDRCGVDVAVDQADLLAQLIADELSLNAMATLVKLRRGDLALVEELVARGSAADGRPIGELDLPPGCVVVAVLRDDDVLVSRSDLRLRAEDEVLAVVHAGSTGELARMLGGPRG